MADEQPRRPVNRTPAPVRRRATSRTRQVETVDPLPQRPKPAKAKKAAAEDPLLSMSDVAKVLGSERFARRLIEERHVDVVKLGKAHNAPVRVRRSVLDAWIDAHTERAVGE